MASHLLQKPCKTLCDARKNVQPLAMGRMCVQKHLQICLLGCSASSKCANYQQMAISSCAGYQQVASNSPNVLGSHQQETIKSPKVAGSLPQIINMSQKGTQLPDTCSLLHWICLMNATLVKEAILPPPWHSLAPAEQDEENREWQNAM